MAITRARTSSVAQGPSTRKTVLGGNDVILGGSYDAIGTVVVGSGGQSTISFTSIPGTYKHLQIRYTGRVNVASNYGQSISIRFNSDSGSNYARHVLGAYTGGYAATSAFADVSQNIMQLFGGFSGGNWTTEMQGAGVTDILDYQNTNKFKTVRSLAGADGNDNSTLISILGFSSGLWRSTSAITSMELTSNADFAQHSQFALYGIK
jgi:hypothetical protein